MARATPKDVNNLMVSRHDVSPLTFRGTLIEGGSGKAALVAEMPEDPKTRFALTPAAPGAARRWIEESFPMPEASRAAVVLLLSELVSNSVRHSGKGQDESVEVSVWPTHDAIHVEVMDPGAGGLRLTTPDADSEHFGLRLVDSIADDWGFSSEPTTVWFEVGAEHPGG